MNPEQAACRARQRVLGDPAMPTHMALAAAAGTGKTHTLLQLLKQLPGNYRGGVSDVLVYVLGPTNRAVAQYHAVAQPGVQVMTIDTFLCTGGKAIKGDLPYRLKSLLIDPWGPSAKGHFGAKPRTGVAVFIIDEFFAVPAHRLRARRGEHALPRGGADPRGPPLRQPRFMVVPVGDPLQLAPVSGRTPGVAAVAKRARRGAAPRYDCRPPDSGAPADQGHPVRLAELVWAGGARPAAAVGHPARAEADALLIESSRKTDGLKLHSVGVDEFLALVYTNEQRDAGNATRWRVPARRLFNRRRGPPRGDAADEGGAAETVRSFVVGAPVIVVGRGLIPAVDADGVETTVPHNTIGRLERGDAESVVVRLPASGGACVTLRADPETGRHSLEMASYLTVHAVQGETLHPPAVGGVKQLIVDCSRLPSNADERDAWIYVSITRASHAMGPDAVAVRHYEPGAIFAVPRRRRGETLNDRQSADALTSYRAHEDQQRRSSKRQRKKWRTGGQRGGGAAGRDLVLLIQLALFQVRAVRLSMSWHARHARSNTNTEP